MQLAIEMDGPTHFSSNKVDPGEGGLRQRCASHAFGLVVVACCGRKASSLHLQAAHSSGASPRTAADAWKLPQPPRPRLAAGLPFAVRFTGDLCFPAWQPPKKEVLSSKPSLTIEASGQAACRPLGRTLMRDRLLNRLGYIVVAVPYGEWDVWRPDAELATYLLARVAAAVAEQRCDLPKDTSALEALAPKVCCHSVAVVFAVIMHHGPALPTALSWQQASVSESCRVKWARSHWHHAPLC